MRIAVERRALSFRSVGIAIALAGAAVATQSLAAGAVAMAAGVAVALQRRTFLILGRRDASLERMTRALALLAIEAAATPSAVTVSRSHVEARLVGPARGPLAVLRFIIRPPRSPAQKRLCDVLAKSQRAIAVIV
ncbi:MAG: hypothetical protein ACRD2J_04820 [Thermoanaerobaculia bacterium]